MQALVCQNVKKNFKSFHALKGVSFTVQEGECFGLLGPNGAGKSTLIGMLYGVVKRSSGSIEIFGKDPALQGRDVRARLGVVTQDDNLDNAMTVIENMTMYARYMGIPSAECLERVTELLEFMHLDHKKNAVIESLSGGMKRRLVFVRALIARPQILILDEPTTGLDPAVRQLLWDKINELKKQGTTVILTTHYMDEAERLCDRLVIMDEGEIRSQGSPKNLIQQHCPAFVAGVTKTPGLGESMERLGFSYYEDKLHGYIGGSSLRELSECLTTSNIVPQFLRPSNLEDVFLKITGRELADHE